MVRDQLDNPSAAGAISAYPFKAFLSYSHQDKRMAVWVHKKLEAYRLSRKARQKIAPQRNIGRICRDETDSRASHSLTVELEEKLQRSEYLIVLCSPQSAQSQWVDREIRHFRDQLQRGQKIIAVWIGGQCQAESFPQALCENGSEPLAPDLRTTRERVAQVLPRPFTDLLYSVHLGGLAQRLAGWFIIEPTALAQIVSTLVQIERVDRESLERLAKVERLIWAGVAFLAPLIILILAIIAAQNPLLEVVKASVKVSPPTQTSSQACPTTAITQILRSEIG